MEFCLGTFGDLRLDKGGGDPRTDGRAYWRLLTTHAVDNAAQAWQIVDWYRARWLIEQLFRVMKAQGLQLEDSQIASADRLIKPAAVATKAACIDIRLTQERDGARGSRDND